MNERIRSRSAGSNFLSASHGDVERNTGGVDRMLHQPILQPLFGDAQLGSRLFEGKQRAHGQASIEAFSMLAYVWRRTRDTETSAAATRFPPAGNCFIENSANQVGGNSLSVALSKRFPLPRASDK
jgi:hypothetical protein